MIRYKIREHGVEILDLAEFEAFRLGHNSFPRNWLSIGGALPAGYVSEVHDATPAPPAPPTRWRVDYLTLLERLSDANADLLAGFVESLPAKVRVRIQRHGVWSDDVQIRTRLTEAGEDPDLVLAA